VVGKATCIAEMVDQFTKLGVAGQQRRGALGDERKVGRVLRRQGAVRMRAGVTAGAMIRSRIRPAGLRLWSVPVLIPPAPGPFATPSACRLLNISAHSAESRRLGKTGRRQLRHTATSGKDLLSWLNSEVSQSRRQGHQVVVALRKTGMLLLASHRNSSARVPE